MTTATTPTACTTAAVKPPRWRTGIATTTPLFGGGEPAGLTRVMPDCALGVEPVPNPDSQR